MPKRKFYTKDELATFELKASVYAFQRRSKGLSVLPFNPKDRQEVSYETISAETGINYNALRAIRPHLEALFRQYPNANSLTGRQQELVDRLRTEYKSRPIPCSRTGSPAYRVLAQDLGCSIATVMRSGVGEEIARLAAANGTAPANDESFDADLNALKSYADGLRQSGALVPWNTKANAPRFAKIGRLIGVSGIRLSTGRLRAACLDLVADLPRLAEEHSSLQAQRLARHVDLALASGRPLPACRGAISFHTIGAELGIAPHRFRIPQLNREIERWREGSAKKGEAA